MTTTTNTFLTVLTRHAHTHTRNTHTSNSNGNSLSSVERSELLNGLDGDKEALVERLKGERRKVRGAKRDHTERNGLL